MQWATDALLSREIVGGIDKPPPEEKSRTFKRAAVAGDGK
jgi:hypothetical protein